MRNTLEKIQNHFHWPGIVAGVQHFYQHCPQCQCTYPYTLAPLVSLPCIGTPFERVPMDIVGPLLKLAWGHKYILVIIDYATCYPEAVPLQKVMSANIARELALLFSHVGIPKYILTDQQTPFISQLTQDLFKLLQV